VLFSRRLAHGLAGAAFFSAASMACIAPPKQRYDAVIYQTRDRPHDKPGESLNKSMMCSCTRCEVATCCREFDQDQPQDTAKCDSYDFEKCGGAGIEVSSCEGRCFQHRWRAPVDKGCEGTRPDACCNASD
jgi:hypothetical protein